MQYIFVDQLKLYPEIYEGYVPMAYGDYLEKMSKYLSAHPCFFLVVSFLEIIVPYSDYHADGIRDGEWGDHVTLQAAADTVSFSIFSQNRLGL